MTKPIRVVQVIDSLSTGGAERLMPVFTNRSNDVGIDCRVICLGPEAETPVAQELSDQSVQVSYVPSSKSRELFDVARWANLKKVLQAHSPDVAHLHLEMSTMVGQPIAARLGIPTVVTLHNPTPELGSFGSVKSVLLKRSLRNADRVLAVGPQVASSWKPRLPDVVIDVVSNPCRSMDPEVSTVRSYDAEGAVTIISVGRLVHQKSFDVLLAAMRIVIDERPEVRCQIAGDGPLRQELQELAAELGLERAVALLGSRSDVDELYAASDIYVSSSSSEGMPLAVIEAMAAGLPIVATRIGDIPEVVPADAGMIVDPGSPKALASALLALIDDAERRRLCGKAARQHALENHNPDRWAERLAVIYRNIAGADGSYRSVSMP